MPELKRFFRLDVFPNPLAPTFLLMHIKLLSVSDWNSFLGHLHRLSWVRQSVFLREGKCKLFTFWQQTFRIAKCTSSDHHQFIISSLSVHHNIHEFIIGSSSVNHQFSINSYSVHHQFLIRSSSVHHQFIIRSCRFCRAKFCGANNRGVNLSINHNHMYPNVSKL